MSEEEKRPLIPKEDVELNATPATARYGICDPTRFLHRILILALMCFVGFGKGFCWESPVILRNPIIEEMGIDEDTFMGLYFWYSWPNIALCVLGGFLIDRYIGIRIGAVSLSTVMLLGQWMVALGGYLRVMWLMNAGRFVFGAGCETLSAVLNTYAVVWFKDSYLNSVLGFQFSVSMIAEIISFNVLLPTYNALGSLYAGEALGYTLWIASFPCVLSLICAMVLASLDLRAENLTNRETHDKSAIHLSDIFYYPLEIWLINLISLVVVVSIAAPALVGVLGAYCEYDTLGVLPPFSNFSNSHPFYIAAAMAPFLGYLVDVTGYHLLWLDFAMVFALFGSLVLNFTLISPWMGTAMISFSYSLLISPLSSIVAFMIPTHKLSTAYGLMQAMKALGIAVVTEISGIILAFNAFFVVQILFYVGIAVAVMLIVLLDIVNMVTCSRLNISKKERFSNRLNNVGRA
ncbi:lysosomal dipeptide transporter MFSD1-like [Clavelina lepadiformis]|uniref:Lysosomal dipeptide transporter MFSD1 n=1 Tax=Clavelina lepadiformis TaxID=159417 RepID=A0ABP0FTH3_CLALP